MERRELLRAIGTAGMAGTTTALAGCNQYTGGKPPDGTRAPHDSWVGAANVQQRSMTALSLDLTSLQALEDADVPTSTEDQAPSDAVVSNPLSGIAGTYLLIAAFGIGFGLRNTGLQSLIEKDGGGELLHIASNAIIVEGSFDEWRLSSAVSNAGWQRVESYEGFTISKRESENSTDVLGLADDVAILILGNEQNQDQEQAELTVADPVAHSKDLIDVNAGNATRYSSTVDAYDDLVTAIPESAMMAAGYDENGELFQSEQEETQDSESADFLGFSDIDLDGNAYGGAVGTSWSSTEVDVVLAIRYVDASEVDDVDAIEEAIGTTARSRDITIDGPMLYVEGTFDSDRIGSQ